MAIRSTETAPSMRLQNEAGRRWFAGWFWITCAVLFAGLCVFVAVTCFVPMRLKVFGHVVTAGMGTNSKPSNDVVAQFMSYHREPDLEWKVDPTVEWVGSSDGLIEVKGPLRSFSCFLLGQCHAIRWYRGTPVR